MDWYEAEVQGMEQVRDKAPIKRRPVVFYGSSSIRLWDSLQADFPGVDVVNAGFGGSTLAACAHFFARLVVPWQPRALVMYAGDNDLGDGQSPEQVLGSLRALLQQMPPLGPIPFGFLAIKISPARWHLRDAIRYTNDLIRQELTTRPASYFIDVVPAMLDSDGKPRCELFTDDGLHLSLAGYQLWTQILSSYHDQLFKEPQATDHRL